MYNMFLLFTLILTEDFYTTNVFPYNYRYEGYGGNLNIKTLIISFLGQIERAKLFRTEDRICATDLWNDWLH